MPCVCVFQERRKSTSPVAFFVCVPCETISCALLIVLFHVSQDLNPAAPQKEMYVSFEILFKKLFPPHKKEKSFIYIFFFGVQRFLFMRVLFPNVRMM